MKDNNENEEQRHSRRTWNEWQVVTKSSSKRRVMKNRGKIR
jgi:hypothetical protein